MATSSPLYIPRTIGQLKQDKINELKIAAQDVLSILYKLDTVRYIYRGNWYSRLASKILLKEDNLLKGAIQEIKELQRLLFAQQLLLAINVFIKEVANVCCMFCCRWHDSLNTTRIGPSVVFTKKVFLSMSDLVAFICFIKSCLFFMLCDTVVVTLYCPDNDVKRLDIFETVIDESGRNNL
ncbi:hypothetical protein ACJX0J_022748 [Zea mays]